jgi:hypothetical protein
MATTDKTGSQILNMVYDTTSNALQMVGASGSIGDVSVVSISGTTPFFDSSVGNTAQALKASSGQLYKLHAINPNVTATYIQLFDLSAGSVTVGTTPPIYVLYVPGNGAVIDNFTIGMEFATAITYTATTTPTGSGAPGSVLQLSAEYK